MIVTEVVYPVETISLIRGCVFLAFVVVVFLFFLISVVEKDEAGDD